MAVSETTMHEFQSGQERALQAFIKEHGKPLRFFAYTIIHDKEAAEEIVADVFFKLWRARVGFATADKVKAFLYIATRNACYDYLDSPKNRVGLLAIDVADELANPQKDLLAQIIEAELVELVYQEINNLPEQQAAVFRMSFLEGLDTDEIRAQLGITANAVFLARSRALAKLKDIFMRKGLVWYMTFIQWMDKNHWGN